MVRFDLHEPGCNVLMKYNSVGAQYWRDKLHAIQNGLVPETEMPSRQQGRVQLDRDVEDDWLLIDSSQVAVPRLAHVTDITT